MPIPEKYMCKVDVDIKQGDYVRFNISGYAKRGIVQDISDKGVLICPLLSFWDEAYIIDLKDIIEVELPKQSD